MADLYVRTPPPAPSGGILDALWSVVERALGPRWTSLLLIGVLVGALAFRIWLRADDVWISSLLLLGILLLLLLVVLFNRDDSEASVNVRVDECERLLATYEDRVLTVYGSSGTRRDLAMQGVSGVYVGESVGEHAALGTDSSASGRCVHYFEMSREDMVELVRFLRENGLADAHDALARTRRNDER